MRTYMTYMFKNISHQDILNYQKPTLIQSHTSSINLYDLYV